jgi:glycine/D-amino acid oxidase-like deaminating enzyme
MRLPPPYAKPWPPNGPIKSTTPAGCCERNPARGVVLGALPDVPQISVFVGARHGFKFASLVGKILGELAIYGRTHYPIEAFRADRPALTDPTYEPTFATWP